MNGWVCFNILENEVTFSSYHIQHGYPNVWLAEATLTEEKLSCATRKIYYIVNVYTNVEHLWSYGAALLAVEG